MPAYRAYAAISVCARSCLRRKVLTENDGALKGTAGGLRHPATSGRGLCSDAGRGHGAEPLPGHRRLTRRPLGQRRGPRGGQDHRVSLRRTAVPSNGFVTRPL